MRQFLYEPSDKAVDLALLLNGIPVATAELKNPLTGQDVEQAIAQYRHDRDPSNWDAVRALVANARERGPGANYLVQHSAGSGKSNSIAWLAHRLASLHNWRTTRCSTR